MNHKIPALIGATLFLLLCAVGVAIGIMLVSPAFAGIPVISSSAATSEPGVSAPAESPLGGTGCWNLVTSPNSAGDNHLTGVAVVSANDVWAVGYVEPPSGGSRRTLIIRWNGSSWSNVTSQNLGSTDNILYAVSVVSANDVWAVGYYVGTGGAKTLTLHYNGSTWSIVTSPNFGPNGNVLYGVTSIAANDVWAVGSYDDTGNGVRRTLAMRWNGTDWLLQSSSNVGLGPNVLYAVDASAANDVWAVGEYSTGTSTPPRTLILRWNGSAWSAVASPNPGSDRNYLRGVTVLSGNNAWAVGAYRNTGGVNQTLTMRWNGSAWSVVSSPSPGPGHNELMGLAAVSVNDVWAVGHYVNADQRFRMLTIHWNGSTWTVANTPNRGDYDMLRAVAAVAANDVWAVGDSQLAGNTTTLVVRYNDPCPTQPTATRTATGAAITATRTGTRTVTRTATRTATSTVTATLPPPCGLAWRVITSPNRGNSNTLEGVEAISSSNVWAVGYSQGQSLQETLTMRWNGSSWSIVPSPNVASSDNWLVDVSAVSANDVWAVGTSRDQSYTSRTLIMRWNGTQWNVVPSPNPTVGSTALLNSVSVISANDVWAVGSYSDGPYFHPLTMRWNGSSWSIVPSPDGGPGYDISLEGVHARASNDVWAVGRLSEQGGDYETLIMRWNGSQWSIVPSPNPGTGAHWLDGVVSLSSNDAWAVGHYYGGGSPGTRGLLLRWDGTSWSHYVAPSSGAVQQVLSDVSASSSTEVWAVGHTSDPESGTGSTLVMRWSGQLVGWIIVPSPVGGPDGKLRGVSAPSGGSNPDVWSVGDFYAGGETRTLVERYNDPCPAATVTATRTAVVTPCPIQFADVPPNNTFYPQVRCLACRGIDTGYACGGPGETCNPLNQPYFRINTLIKRDDLAHMVAASAGFSEDPGPRRFQDVPTSNPYYVWVQRMANRGLIGGYPCGGPGEPCVPPDNRAYYRPSANATRGQIAKIVSNGAGYNEPPLGQFFTDVPPGSPFYEWVQRLTNRGVMSGYPCGGPNEPCDAQNRPYFRWQNDSTRGQVAKITANTFFPNCITPGGR